MPSYPHRAAKEGFSITLSLIHPRWWLDGPPTAPSKWKVEYYDATIDSSPSLRHENLSLYHDSGENLVLRSAGEITAAQDALGSEGSEKLAEIFARQNDFWKHSSYGSKHEATLELVCHCYL